MIGGCVLERSAPVADCVTLSWPGSTVVIIASGPSLTRSQCEAVRYWRANAASRRAIVVNTSFRLAPWADVLYGGDDRWWRMYHREAIVATQGIAQFWTGAQTAHRFSDLHVVPSTPLPGLGRAPGPIHRGGNSGYQAINLAYRAGARRIVLLGFDMHDRGGSHWHGDHPPGIGQRGLFPQWLPKFDVLADDLRAEGVRVINATPQSALTCFGAAGLTEALA